MTLPAAPRHLLMVGLPAALVAAYVVFSGADVDPLSAVLLMIVWAVYLGLCSGAWKRSPHAIFNPDSLLLLVMGAYVMFPMSVNTLMPELFHSERASRHFDPVTVEENRSLVLCALMAMAGLAGGFALVTRVTGGPLPGLDGEWGPDRFTAAAALVTGGATLMAVLILVVGVDRYTGGAYVDSYAAEDGLGFLRAGIILFQLGLFVLYISGQGTSNRRTVEWIVFVLFLVLAAFEIRIGRRRSVLETGVGLLTLRHFCVQPFRKSTLIIGGCCALVAFAAIGQARAFMHEGLGRMIEYVQTEFSLEDLGTMSQEINVVPFTTNETIRLIDSGTPHRYGATYVEAFEILIPQKLHPDRSLAPSQWFVWQVDPDSAARGGGLSYSHVAEGYLNGGFVGVALAYVFFGVLVRTVAALRESRPRSAGRLLLVATLNLSMISLVRSDFASLLKSYVVTAWVPALAVVLFLDWQGRGRLRAMPPLDQPLDRPFDQPRQPHLEGPR